MSQSNFLFSSVVFKPHYAIYYQKLTLILYCVLLYQVFLLQISEYHSVFIKFLIFLSTLEEKKNQRSIFNIGELTKNTGKVQFESPNKVERIIIKFENMQLNDIQRENTSQAVYVTEQKYALIFEAKVQVSDVSEKVNIKPVVHLSQTCFA